MSLVVNNINFGYASGFPLLKNVSFEVGKGETLGILGVSGSGKSTLLKILSGLVEVGEETKILFDGKTPSEIMADGRLSFMFQEPTLLENLTVFENVALPLRILKKYDNGRVRELLELVGLSDAAQKLPKQLSGGMKTRTALARSFITNPLYLLLDEAFNSLDIVWQTDLYKTLFRLQQKFNTTIVIVSHNIEELVYLSNRVLVISKTGNIIESVTLQQELPRKFEFTNVAAEFTQQIKYASNLIYSDASSTDKR